MREILDSIFLQAGHLITGLFRQAPLVFVKKGCVLRTFTMVHMNLLHSYVLKSLTHPNSHPLHPILRSELTNKKPTFPSPLHSLLLPRKPFHSLDNLLQEILPSPTPPWVTPVPEVRNLGMNHIDAIHLVSKQILSEQENNAMVIFTGSLWIQEEGAGAAAVVHGTDYRAVVSLSSYHTITHYETELVDVHLASQLSQDRRFILTSDYDGVAIFCDNQGTFD